MMVRWIARSIAAVTATCIGTGAAATTAISDPFELDTLHASISGAAVSPAFVMDTYDVRWLTREALSVRFLLDTRGLYTPVSISNTTPSAYDIHADSTVPYILSPSSRFEQWTGAWTPRGDDSTYTIVNRNVYIIAHGWQPALFNAEQLGDIDWMVGIAARLADVDPDAVILGWNWIGNASATFPGNARSQIAGEADRLAELVISRGLARARSIHWIGHSFGSGVVSLAALRVVRDPGTTARMRVTTLDPPENALPLVGAARLNLGSSAIPGLAGHSVLVDNYITEFGTYYTSAVNIDLKGAADSSGTPMGWAEDHGLAPHWFLQTILDNSPSLLPSQGQMKEYFHYFNAEDRSGTWAGRGYLIPNAVARFWTGVEDAGFNYSSAAREGVWRPAPVRWGYLALLTGLFGQYYSLQSIRPLGADAWPILYTGEYQGTINLCARVPQGLPGYYPFSLQLVSGSAKSDTPVDFESTYTTVGDDVLASPEGWQASDTAYLRDTMLYLTASPEAYAYRTLTISADTSVMHFQCRFEGVEGGDRVFVYINDSLVHSAEAFPSMEATFDDSGWLDVLEWAGQTVELTVLASRAHGSESMLPLFVTIRNLEFAAEEPSYWMQDSDEDGLNNYDEWVNGTDPELGDSDGDGLPDGWEVLHGLAPLVSADGAQDADTDGFTNWEEYDQGSDPNNPEDPGIEFPFGDVNEDGAVNAMDVQLVINGALGRPTGEANVDLDHDGLVNAMDVQLVINAVLGRV